MLRWMLFLLLCCLSWTAQADTIYLCKAYSGGMFWSAAICSSQGATLDRAVSVPSTMTWDQKVNMGEASWAQARAVTAPAQPTYQQQSNQQPQQSAKQAECQGLAGSIANLDAQMRLPQSGQMQDILKKQRQQLSDQRYRMQC